MAKYEHRDADNRWHAFSDADNQVIEDAYRANKNKILLTMPQNPPGLREFEVRFGDNARSERMPRPPSTKIIQVNVASGATRANCVSPATTRLLRQMSMPQRSRCPRHAR